MKDGVLDQFLSLIERTELRSLTWGYVDGSLTYEDLAALFLGEGLGDPDTLEPTLDVMLDHALLIRTWSEGVARYRSRFAETLRLLVHLRQVTPTKRWDVAPDLVSDYRVTTGPRRVPTRTFSAADVVDAWSAATAWDEHREEACRAFLDATGSVLSRFQVEVGTAVLRAGNRDAGLVVTAGTGAGKTLAYYLPVAVEIAQHVRPESFWTKAISLYPRTELLKDQMSEVFRIAADVSTRGAGNRPLRLGALFEPVPVNQADASRKWTRTKQGLVCPFLRCPACDSDMVWGDSDLRAAREILTCVGCQASTGSRGEIGLTRDSLRQRPPDLLFISAEMVNQRLSDPSYRVLLGLAPKREERPRFLLLDEIHTYGGTTGAQVAGVLRRYRHALAGPLFVVGLSATLRDAPEFLAELSGIPPHLCREISPSDEDMESVSGSYQVVLKANSSNRTSVLSTTIQTTFLLGRMLDSPRSEVSSGGRYGTRTFVFLDTLDVTNRLFDDLRDAEGTLHISDHPPLAALRPARTPGEQGQRDVEGQEWHAPEQIHGSLTAALRVSRTSSQDAGVDSESDIVIATPSLEVGYNDPRVGAVVQHRGPRDLATFVQRRGRAGRQVSMRPWMVTVLSEYGRDRLSFQMYEQLFDPTLPARHLPIRNRYVLRIQATFALLDWLVGQVKRPSSMWAALSGPSAYHGQESTRHAVLDVLDRLLGGDQALMASLARHLRGALQVDDRELSALLWLPPRSLLAEVVPTLRRRLTADWRTWDGQVDHLERWHPLPDFVPRALFQDLLVPDVLLQVPSSGRPMDSEARLPIAQALREFAPGRVSRRLAVHDPLLSHWVEPQPLIQLDVWMPDRDLIGTVYVDGHELPLFRPWTVATSSVPKTISKSSYGSLDWITSLERVGEGAILRLPSQSPMAVLFDNFEFHLHSRRNPITVTRFAARSHASVVSVGGSTRSEVSTFVEDDGTQVAVGFIQDVDGIKVRINVPPAEDLVHAIETPAGALWRSSFLRSQIARDVTLSAIANPFELAWIADAVLLAVAREGLRQDPERALSRVLDDLWGSLRSAVDLMHMAGIGPEVDELATGLSEQEQGALGSRLREMLDDAAFLEALEGHLREAIDPSATALGVWAQSEYVAAAGGVLLTAAAAMLPNRAGVETLIVDLEGDGSTADIWITETTLGGGGIVEAIAEAFAADSWRFVRGLEAAIAPGDAELLSSALARSVDLFVAEPELGAMAQRARTASTHNDRVAANLVLAAGLTQHGVSVDQSLLVALNQRIFRAGTDARLDALLGALHGSREELARSTGLWPELRLFAIAAAASTVVAADFRPLVQEWRGGAVIDDRTLGASILATLWPAVEDVRPLGIEYYNPYASTTTSDPEWLRRFSPLYGTPVPISDADWRERVLTSLNDEGKAILSGATLNSAELRDIAQELVATPIAMGSLVVYPTLAAVTSDATSLIARFEIRELG